MTDQMISGIIVGTIGMFFFMIAFNVTGILFKASNHRRRGNNRIVKVTIGESNVHYDVEAYMGLLQWEREGTFPTIEDARAHIDSKNVKREVVV